MHPTNAKEEVVLVLEIAGLTPEEFQKISDEKIYLIIGKERRIFQIMRSGVWGGGPKIVLAGIVPKAAREYQLFMGDALPVTIKAPGKIVPETN